MKLILALLVMFSGLACQKRTIKPSYQQEYTKKSTPTPYKPFKSNSSKRR